MPEFCALLGLGVLFGGLVVGSTVMVFVLSCVRMSEFCALLGFGELVGEPIVPPMGFRPPAVGAPLAALEGEVVLELDELLAPGEALEELLVVGVDVE